MMYRYTTLLRQTASNALESSSSVSSTLRGNYRLLSLSLSHTHTHTHTQSSFWSLLTWHEIMNCCLREQLHLCAQPGQTQIFDKKWYYSITPRASQVCTCHASELKIFWHHIPTACSLSHTWLGRMQTFGHDLWVM